MITFKAKITLEDLKLKVACDEGLALFENWFGSEVEIEWSHMHELLCRIDPEIKEFTVWVIDSGLLPKFSFSKSNLRGTDLRWANLRGTDLRWANLRWADLRWADLRWADLQEANLRWADLRWADLREANIQEADLREADLRGADLRWADLRGADLRWANLTSAILPDNYKDLVIL